MQILKKKTRTVPMNLFFIELIIVLLFFSISGAVIMEMFTIAQRRATRNDVTEKAVLDVQSLSELYSQCGDMETAAAKLYGKDHLFCLEDKTCTVYLSDDAKALGADEVNTAVIKLVMNETADVREYGRYSELSVIMEYPYEINTPFYKHICSAYIPMQEKEAVQ